MFKFTKKLAIAASFVVLYSGDHAFGSNGDDVIGDEAGVYNNHLVNTIPNDIWKNILAAASEVTEPDNFAPVCRKFNSVMRDTRGFPKDLNNLDANNFKQHCMKIRVNNRFKNGILRYTPEDSGAVVELKFSDLANPFCETFDLSECGDRSQYIRITTSVEEFFKVRGENEGRLVVLTCPYHVIEQAIQLNPAHPFSKIMANWAKSKAPIGMFWRWGNWDNTLWFDYLVSLEMKALSEKSLYENWEKSGCVMSSLIMDWRRSVRSRSEVFVLIFDKPELDIKDKSPRKKPRV